MELKLRSRQINRSVISFNRTFMELKYDNTVSIRLEIKSFNRTFMELKSDRK